MEFSLSFADLFERIPNKIGVIFIPVFLVTILAETLVIQARHGSYPWKNTGISAVLALGHLLTQAAAHGVIFIKLPSNNKPRAIGADVMKDSRAYLSATPLPPRALPPAARREAEEDWGR